MKLTKNEIAVVRVILLLLISGKFADRAEFDGEIDFMAVSLPGFKRITRHAT